MRIHAVQYALEWENREANQQRLRRFLAGAAIEPGDMVVLPEMFDVGFSMNTGVTTQGPLRESEDFLQQIASEWQCCIVGGVVTASSNGCKPGNEAVAFAPDGACLARYRKMHVFRFAGEHEHYAAGDDISLFTWQGLRCAVFICYDLRFPECYRAAAAAGAEVLITIANWPAKRSQHWSCLLQARAIENQCYSIGVNRVGDDPSLHYDGHSAIFDFQGREVVSSVAQETLLSADIDRAGLQDWRQTFPALLDRR